jgi:hypothetical protein
LFLEKTLIKCNGRERRGRDFIKKIHRGRKKAVCKKKTCVEKEAVCGGFFHTLSGLPDSGEEASSFLK